MYSNGGGATEMSEAGQAHYQAKGLDGAILDVNRALTQAGPVFWVAFYGVALILAIALGTSLMISSVRDREIKRTGQELEGSVRLLAKQFDENIQTFEAVPKSVVSYLVRKTNTPEQFRDLASSEGFHRLLREKISDTTDFAGVNVFDAEGNFLNSSERWPVPSVNLSDRTFFKTFKMEPASSSASLIQLVDSRVSKGSAIVFARRVSTSNGTFLGMVTRSISPARFESFFSTILLKDSAFALFHKDGSLLASYPNLDEAVAKHLFETQLTGETFADGAATGQGVNLVDEQENLVIARSLEHAPIYVVAMKMTSAALVGWSRETRTLVVAALLAALVVGVMLIAIVRYLKEQHRRLNIAVNNMAQGLLLYDASGRLVLCNQQYLDMFGLSPEIVKPGCLPRDIIQHRKDTGSFTGDVDEYCERTKESCSKSGLISLMQIPDGRWIQVANKVVDGGGWVSTIEDITERRCNEERTIRLASHDTLTELPNRALLRSHLAGKLETCGADEQVAVLFLDMDEFKAVNDTLGHQIGDELLRSVARSLQSCAGPGEFVARLGGDEFAVVASGITDKSHIMTVIERIYMAVRRSHQCSSHHLAVDISIGVAIASSPETTCDDILLNADLAMYDAKSSGKRTHRFFEAQMEKKARDRRQLETDLREALAAGSIDVHYQPIVDMKTNAIIGCEALARWTRADGSSVSPAEFIPVAEQSGLIEGLGEYVLNAACREAAAWPNSVKLAVNVSPAQFKSGVFALKVIAALAHSGLSPNRLELEVTEAILIDDDEGALKVLHEMKTIGVRVALDDFGTGYSSLSYLRRFPFDKIKIDRSFISGLTEETSSSAIVRAVVAMATEYNMVTTAEGVETETQRGILRQLGCAQMQGFLFSRARTSADILQMFKDAYALLPAARRDQAPLVG
jgi:diguanylate cyclase (GGDEF)-like protein